MQKVFRLGTRQSLLAMAQSGWVAREIEKLNPDVKVELVTIGARGDKLFNVLLQCGGTESKGSFVKDLDDALIFGRVDFTVHAMKDLCPKRPIEIVCAAIPKRENPRDVMLFDSKVTNKLREGRPIRVGTPSPRRLETLSKFFRHALPAVEGDEWRVSAVEFVDIHGSITSRLSRVHEPESSGRKLDGVVLALAGLVRLWADVSGRVALSKLLRDVRWMVLPLKECPSAPAQGALAVECRASDQTMRELLRALHDSEADRQIKMERKLLTDWGDEWPPRFGVTAFRDLLFIRGRKPDGSLVDEVRWNGSTDLKAPVGHTSAWNGSAWRADDGVEEISLAASDATLKSAVFVAHSRAVTPEWAMKLQNSRIWTPGVSSWFRLARQGLWVEGCAECFGIKALEPILTEDVLQLPTRGEGMLDWSVLTHDKASMSWKNAHVVHTYRLSGSYSAEARQALRSASHIYWSSGSQYDNLSADVRPDAHHSCGTGKTAEHLRAKGINPQVFPSEQEWTQWLSLREK